MADRLQLARLLFFAPIAMQGAVTLLTIPIVVHAYGLVIWSSIAIGQSIGGIGLTLFSLGWGFTGPTLLAKLSAREGRELLVLSLATKLTAAIPVTLLMLLAVVLIDSGNVVLTFLSAVATASVGFSATWYFVGLARPQSLLLLDALPRASAMVLGALAVLWSGPVVLVPLAQLVGTAAAVSISLAGVLGTRMTEACRTLSVRGVIAALGRQSQGVGTAISSAGFSNATLPLVSILLPGLTPGFALIDKVQKQLVAAAAPVGSIIVAAMAHGLRTKSEKRVARESALTLLRIALPGVLFCVPLTWLLLAGLSLNNVAAGWWVVGPLAVLIGLSFVVGASPAAVLAPLRRLGRGAWSVSVGGLVGVIGAISLGAALGLPGILVGLVVGQVVALCAQWVGVVFGPGDFRSSLTKGLTRGAAEDQ